MTRLPYCQREDDGVRRERIAGSKYLRLLSIGFVLLAMLLTSVPSYATPTSKTRPDEPIATGGVFNYQISADGQYAVHLADKDQDQFYELYSVNIKTETTIQLGVAKEANARGLNVQITTDSQYVVYQLGSTSDIFSVPIAGGSSIRLNNAQQTPANLKISPDNQYVIYVSDPPADGWFSVPITGGTPIRIGGSGSTIEFSPDSSYVVASTLEGELYATPINGGTPVILNGDRTPGPFSVRFNFTISADSNQVVFAAEQGTENVGLFSVPIIGGTPVRISALPTEMAIIGPSFQISPDGNHVAYTIDLFGGKQEFYLASLTGADPIKINIPEGSFVSSFSISQDNAYVHYIVFQRTNQVTELYGVSTNGGEPFKITQSTRIGFRYTSDGQHLIYSSDQETPDISELYKVGLTGGEAVKLNHPLSGNETVITSQVTSDSKSVVYSISSEPGFFILIDEIYQASLTGGAPIKLTQKPANGRPITGFAVSPNSEFFIYSVDRNGDGRDELYKRNLVSN